jgi:hypothetical protein
MVCDLLMMVCDLFMIVCDRDLFMVVCDLLFIYLLIYLLCFNATFNNILAISWQPVLVVEEAGVPGENHRLWASNW